MGVENNSRPSRRPAFGESKSDEPKGGSKGVFALSQFACCLGNVVVIFFLSDLSQI